MMKKLCFLSAIFIANLDVSHSFYYNDTALLRGLADRHLFKYYNQFGYNETIDFLRLLTDSQTINLKCKVSLKRWITGIERNELWALKFLQSTGKSVNGKLVGRDLNLGSFDFCMDFMRDERQGIEIDFDGKYCLVSVHGRDAEEIEHSGGFREFRHQLSERSQRLYRLGMGSAHGLCMPSTCDINEVAEVFNGLVKPYGFNVLTPDRCTTVSEPEPITGLAIISILILGSFILFCLLAFFFENKFLSNFSIARNLDVIYSVKSDPNNSQDESSSILHGIKFQLVFASIVLHNLGLPMSLLFTQMFSSCKEVTSASWVTFLGNRIYFISDGMFFLGGFFAFWGWYDAVQNAKIKLNLFTFFSVRYSKVFAIVTIMILFTFVMPLLGSGPFYSQLTNHFVQNCKQNFWREYLLISNEQSFADMCIVPSWFLSADFHAYLMNYFVIYYLLTRPKLGFLIAFAQAVLINAFQLWYLHRNRVTTLFSFWDLNVDDNSLFQDVYLPSFLHLNTYLLGIIGAFVIKKKLKPRFLDFTIVRFVLWIIALSALPLFLVYLNHLEATDADRNSYFFLFLPMFLQIVNLILPYFLFYSVLMGYLTPLKKFWSMKIFVPWSRLSFTLIIGQFIYLTYSAASSRNAFTFDRLTIWKESIFALVAVTLIGNFISLVIDQPIFNLLQAYMGVKKRSDTRIDSKVKSKAHSKRNAKIDANIDSKTEFPDESAVMIH